MAKVEEQIVKEDVETSDISENNLEQHGWKLNELDAEKFNIKSWDKMFRLDDKEFHCTLRKDSNTKGREWSVHVDNSDFETVGSMDVSSYSQIEKLLNLL